MILPLIIEHIHEFSLLDSSATNVDCDIFVLVRSLKKLFDAVD